MKPPLSTLTDNELQSFAQLLRNGKNGLPDAAVNELALALGLPAVGTATAFTPDELAEKMAAEASLYEFVRAAWDVVEPDVDFIDGDHVRAVCDHIEAVIWGEIPNLLANVPPGCMKSLCACVFAPAWSWIHKPSLRWLFASYEQSLSTRDSMRCRQIIQSPWYRRRWGDRFELVGDQNEKTRYDTDKRGWRIATSVGGRGTGEHPDIIVADDPHKVKEAESDTERLSAIRWWDGTISSRGKIRGVRRIVVMQRLHQSDLSGHILETDAGVGRWVHLCLPMRFEPDRMKSTPLGWSDPRTEPGQLLWPAAFPERVVAELEREMGTLRAAGQLQQRPVPLGGQLFHRDWFEIVPASPVNARRVRYWDKAGTQGGGAYTAGVRISLATDGVFYVEDVRRAQLSPARRNALTLQTAETDADQFDNTVEIWLEQEPGSGGKESAQISVKQLRGFPVHLDRVTGDKVSRAIPFAAQAEAGNVKLVRGPWNTAYLDELESFPNGTYKDQVDGSSGAFNKLAATRGSVLGDDELLASGDPTEREEESRRFTSAEVAELPSFLRELISETRAVRAERDE